MRAAIGLVLLAGCSSMSDVRAEGGGKKPRVERNCVEADANGNCKLYGVSLIELIANPDKYNGKRVSLTGYLHLEFEGNGVYVSKNDFDHRLHKNGVWISVAMPKEPNAVNDVYVILDATFNADNQGHLGLWSGSLEKVTRLNPWK